MANDTFTTFLVHPSQMKVSSPNDVLHITCLKLKEVNVHHRILDYTTTELNSTVLVVKGAIMKTEHARQIIDNEFDD